MKFGIGTRVRIVKNATESDSWDKYIDTYGVVEGISSADQPRQPYKVKLDLDGLYGMLTSFSEEELGFANDKEYEHTGIKLFMITGNNKLGSHTALVTGESEEIALQRFKKDIYPVDSSRTLLGWSIEEIKSVDGYKIALLR